MSKPLRSVAALASAATALAVCVPAVADAHIQVRPAEAAPLDPVLWTVLVPNEREQGTDRIELAVPPGVVPFSFQDQPGWERHLTYNKDKSTRSIVWEGQLASDGLAEFSFLATTPGKDGTIAWKAIQTYDDGKLVRWIGPEGSEEPASFTTISSTAAPQNAGGEGGGAEVDSNASEDAPPVAEVDEGSDALPIALGMAGILLGAAALLVALRARRLNSEGGRV